MSILGRFSSKIIIIFILIFATLFAVVFTSYLAIDTQKQHIAITEIIGAERMAVERLTDLTTDIAKSNLGNNTMFMNDKSQVEKVINSRMEIDNIFVSLYKRQYRLIDGEIYQLRFRGEFEKKLYKKVDDVVSIWKNARDISSFLINADSIENKEEYLKKYNEFNAVNPKLLTLSDELVVLCLNEANVKRKISVVMQASSIIISVVILAFLISFIIKNLYKPLNEIKSVFNNMSKGIINQRFQRNVNDEFKKLYEGFNYFIENLNLIFILEDKIILEDDLGRILRYIYDNFTTFLPFREIGIKYISENSVQIRGIRDGRAFQSGNEDAELEKQDKLVAVCKDDLCDEIKVPIIIGEANLGFVYFRLKDGTVEDEAYINFLELIRNKLSLAFYKGFLFKDLLAIVTKSLAKVAECKDPETGNHLKRMALYSREISRNLSENDRYKDIISEEFIQDILFAAPMHDIGKVSIKDEILFKPGKLTDEEFEIMKTHTSTGGEVLDQLNSEFGKYNIGYFKMASEIAWGHQEKYDGSGYPRALKGEKIPLSARICAVADVFDALSSKRPYKEAFPLEKCYSIMKDSKGTHFDSDIVDAFFNIREVVEEIYEKYREI